jgi:hypothetical protein
MQLMAIMLLQWKKGILYGNKASTYTITPESVAQIYIQYHGLMVQDFHY